MTKNELKVLLAANHVAVPTKLNRDGLLALAAEHGLVSMDAGAPADDQSTQTPAEGTVDVSTTTDEPSAGGSDPIDEPAEPTEPADENVGVEPARNLDLLTEEGFENVLRDRLAAYLDTNPDADAEAAELNLIETLEAERSELETKAEAAVAEVPAGRTKGSSIVPAKYKEIYGKSGSKNDDLAIALRNFCNDDKGKVILDRLHRVMADNGIDTARWSGLNIGQRRMNTGNILRSRAKNGGRVVVGDVVFNEKTDENKSAA